MKFPVPVDLVPLPIDEPIWDHVYAVSSLVIVGTREEDGSYDLAPKHLAGPLSWGPWYGFVCHPRHATYSNAVREGAFTVSWPRPSQVLLSSLAAAPRCDGQKHSLAALSTIPAREVDGVLLERSQFVVECTLDRVIDGLDENSLLIGKVVAAMAHPDALRSSDRDDNEVVRAAPLLAYLAPNRFATIDTSQAFPFPQGYSR